MSDIGRLRAAVIGLGRMGMHHVRTCLDSDDVDLVAVLDHKPDWAVSVGADTHSLVVADIETLLDKVDVAIVAVPTVDHAVTSESLLRNSVSCLVEKPMALTEAEANSMIEAADTGGARLQIGHIERFNPAVQQLLRHLKEEESVQEVSVRRHNCLSDRSYDVDAVLDLMIHELDLLTLFTDTEIESLHTEKGANFHRVAATVTYASGLMARFSVDRDAAEPVRDMVIQTSGATYTLDLTDQLLSRQSEEWRDDILVEPGDALHNQLRAFAAFVRTGRPAGATGQDGRSALTVANRIRSAARLLE